MTSSSSATPSVFAELSEAFGSGAVDDPYSLFARKRQVSPVMEGDIMLELGAPSFAGAHQGPVFTLLRHDAVWSALRDHSTFSSGIWLELMEPLMGRNVVGLDGDEHRMWRGLFTQVFTRRALPEWKERIMRPIARELVAQLAPAGRADLVDFAFRFPLRAIYEVIGFGDDPEAFERFAELALNIVMAIAADPDPAKAEQTQQTFVRAGAAAAEVLELITSVVQRTRAAGATRTDLISHLIHSEFENRTLDDDEIATFVRSLLLAATETTTRQFLNAGAILFTRPDLLAEIRDEPGRREPFLREVERYEPTNIALPRVTTRAVEIGGVEIPEGAAVILSIGSANRDEAAYPRPDEFVLDRQGPPPLTFGFGSHVCPGMNVSRIEMRTMFDVLFEELPGLRPDPDAEPPVIRGVALRGPAALPVVWG